MRSYSGIFSPVYGAIGTLDKISNNSSAITAWEKQASAAFGDNVTVFDQGFNASAGQSFIWVVSDRVSTTIPLSQSIGCDLSSQIHIRDAIRRLSADNSSSGMSASSPGIYAPPRSEDVAVTSLLYMNPVQKYGVGLFTAIRDGDDSRLVFSIFALEAYLNQLLAPSAGAVATLTDHTGSSFSQGDCRVHDAVSALSKATTLTTNTTWTVRVGEWSPGASLFPAILLLLCRSLCLTLCQTATSLRV